MAGNEYVGIDISKSSFDAYSEKCGSKEFPNSLEGFKDLVAWISNDVVGTPKVVLEATGGYHREVVNYLQSCRIKVSVVNPKRVRDFAKAVGVFAKTDKIDAKVLALFGRTLCPAETRHVPVEEAELNALVVRREQLVEQCTQEKNRLEHTKGEVREDIRTHIRVLEKRIKKMEKLIQDTIDKNDTLKHKSDTLRSVKGIGPTATGVLLAKLPELGQWNSKSIVSLVGVAPFPDESGKHSGSRRIFGGREPVRSVLYMCTLSAIRSNSQIKQFYNRLLDKGKAKKVAIVACMRKLLVILHALVAKGQQWDPSMNGAATNK